MSSVLEVVVRTDGVAGDGVVDVVVVDVGVVGVVTESPDAFEAGVSIVVAANAAAETPAPMTRAATAAWIFVMFMFAVPFE